MNRRNKDQTPLSFAVLEEDFFLLQAKAENILLDTVGLGQKMQDALDRHGAYLNSAVLWKTLQSKE